MAGSRQRRSKGSKAAAVEVPVPASEHGNESGFGGEGQEADPWRNWQQDPWASRASDVTPEPPVMQPSLDGYLQFCTWWQTAMQSESGEKSFSVGDSAAGGGHHGNPVDGHAGGRGCRHRQPESRDPGKQEARGHNYERDQPPRRPNVARSDPGVRRGGGGGGHGDPSEPGDGHSNGSRGGGKPPPKKSTPPEGQVVLRILMTLTDPSGLIPKVLHVPVRSVTCCRRSGRIRTGLSLHWVRFASKILLEKGANIVDGVVL